MLRGPLRIVEQGRLGFSFATSKRGDHAGDLQGGNERITLADGRVGGITWHPAFLQRRKFPGRASDMGRRIFKRQFDPGFMVKAKTMSLGGD